MRFVAFWMPKETFDIDYAGGRHLERFDIYLVTLSSVLGIAILWKRDGKSALLLISCLTVFPLVYYIIQFEYRYRYPIMWTTFLVGAMPLTAFARQISETLRLSLQVHRTEVQPKFSDPVFFRRHF
jgi:hypothetical protein